jgi:beta-barrel assembly-enhancing protease
MSKVNHTSCRRRLGAVALLPVALAQLMTSSIALSTFAPVAANAADTVDLNKLNPDLKEDAVERKPGQVPVPTTLEGGIWAESAKAEQKAKTSGERNHDAALHDYVNGVLDKAATPFGDDLRLYVMDRPFFNASMAPNGYTEVWTGTLLRCQTEDELAFVLGHEAGHFRHSHSVKTYQAAKDGQNAALAASMLLSVVAMGASMNASSVQAIQNINNIASGLINIVYLGTVAAYFGYSRETEGQADTYGLTYIKQAGYYTGAASDVWASRLDETAASDYEKVRRSPARVNVFGGHPLETVRLSALEKQERLLNGGASATRSEDDAKAARTAYRGKIRPYLSAWLKDDLRRQDYGQTLWVVKRLSIDGEDAGLLNFYAGEAYRLRGGRGAEGPDLEKAIDAYKTALQSSDAPKETHRQLGDVYRRLGATAEAIDSFKAYLAAAPDAADAWMIQDQIDTLSMHVPPPAAAPTTSTNTTGGTVS